MSGDSMSGDAPAKSEAVKPLSSAELAHQLFAAVFPLCDGDVGAASLRVIGFLADSLVYAVSMTVGENEVARKSLLKHVGEKIINASPPPATGKP